MQHLTKNLIWIVTGAIAFALIGIGVAGAQPLTRSVGYQGRVTDANGQPLDGAVAMRFLVYDAATGGTALWDGDVQNVAVDDGLFHAQLGVDQADFNGQGLWLEILVEGEALSPRQPILATGYALGLLPGAQVKRTNDGDALTVRNLATGFAVRAESSQGIGLYGFSDDNYAVYGFDGGTEQARGYGGYFYSENGVGAYGRSNAESTEQNLWAPGVYGNSSAGVGVYARTQSNLTYMAAVRGENDGFGYGGYFSSEDGVPLYGIRNTGSGNMMELWTLDPVSRVFRINTFGSVFANGTYNSPAADFAEMMAAQPGLEPGDVLVIGEDGKLARSSSAYQATVVGVYSTQPAFVGGMTEDGEQSGKIPMAVTGIVPVKVSSENGAIAAGDLLVSSSTPGHAMRCEGIDACFGRTIGKALEGLETGSGEITMLVQAR